MAKGKYIRTKEVREKQSIAMKGKNTYLRSDETKKKISQANKGMFSDSKRQHLLQLAREHVGKNNSSWKGDKVGYFALHAWIKRWLGHPDKCEFCGAEGNYNLRQRNGKIVKVWNVQWANKSRDYKRDLTDWLQLCIKCHKNYDLQKQYV